MIIEQRLNDDIAINENNAINSHINHEKPKLANSLIAFLSIVFVTTLLAWFFKLNIYSKKEYTIDTKMFTELRILDSPSFVNGYSLDQTCSIFDENIKVQYLYGYNDEFAYGNLRIKSEEYTQDLTIIKYIYNNNITRKFGEYALFTFQIEKIPGVYMKMTFMGTCTLSTIFDKDNNQIHINLFCDLKVNAKVTSGSENVKSISVGASGTLFKGEFQAICDRPGKNIWGFNDMGFGKNIKIYVDGVDLENKEFHYEIADDKF